MRVIEIAIAIIVAIVELGLVKSALQFHQMKFPWGAHGL